MMFVVVLMLRIAICLNSYIKTYFPMTVDNKQQQRLSFLCLKNENIMEGLLLQPEGIHLYTYIPTYLPIVEGIRNVVTIGIIPTHNPNNQ